MEFDNASWIVIVLFIGLSAASSGFTGFIISTAIVYFLSTQIKRQ